MPVGEVEERLPVERADDVRTVMLQIGERAGDTDRTPACRIA
jgi:hypothetical protein